MTWKNPGSWLANVKRLVKDRRKGLLKRLKDAQQDFASNKNPEFVAFNLERTADYLFGFSHALDLMALLHEACDREDITPEQMLAGLKQRVEMAERNLLETPAWRHNSTSLVAHVANLSKCEALVEFRSWCVQLVADYPVEDLRKELQSVVEAFLAEQEKLKEPFRNEVLCADARAVLEKCGRKF